MMNLKTAIACHLTAPEFREFTIQLLWRSLPPSCQAALTGAKLAIEIQIESFPECGLELRVTYRDEATILHAPLFSQLQQLLEITRGAIGITNLSIRGSDLWHQLYFDSGSWVQLSIGVPHE